MASRTTKLNVVPRTERGSRESRRLRREGFVPGIVYGQGIDTTSIKVKASDLRAALTSAGAVIELALDGGKESHVILKDQQYDPVRGDLLHVDFMEVRLDEAISSAVPLELINSEDSPGVKEGGVLEQVTREVNVRALPADIPDRIAVDVSALEMAETLLLEGVPVPVGVELTDDAATVIATITAPTELEEPEEVEEEIELVGEEAEEVEGEEVPAEAEEEAAGEAAEKESESEG